MFAIGCTHMDLCQKRIAQFMTSNMDTYMDNVKKAIKRNMISAQDHDDYDPYEFIEEIDKYLSKLWDSGGPKKKPSKTRHG